MAKYGDTYYVPVTPPDDAEPIPFLSEDDDMEGS